MSDDAIRAVLFDFGGVILTSPFEAFAHYEARNGLPAGFIRQVNATNHHHNAWARLERNEVTLAEFATEFEAEAADLGQRVDGREVIACLRGEVRPEMVRGAPPHRRGRAGPALLTNNFLTGTAEWSSGGSFSELVALFDVVVESSRSGCASRSGASTRSRSNGSESSRRRSVFLDDLGINLKPARDLGMTTIKVGDPEVALAELSAILGIALS